jgi:hypothetical protein
MERFVNVCNGAAAQIVNGRNSYSVILGPLELAVEV